MCFSLANKFGSCLQETELAEKTGQLAAFGLSD
jgi:hypothetical protein